MRTLPGSVQSLIDADSYRPVVTATIILRDNSTILYLATQDITIAAQPYVGDLVEIPRVTVSSGSGVDHLTLTLTETTDPGGSPYAAYEVLDLFDGAECTVNMYFATDATYSTLEGPVSLFAGVVSEPVVNNDTMVLTVMSNSRITVGTIGRTITKQCLNTFKDANCGYTFSATINAAGTYNAGDQIPIDNTGYIAEQDGRALKGEGVIGVWLNNLVEVKNGATPVVTAVVQDSDIAAGWVKLSQAVTTAVGYTIEYVSCPRDSMESCARRWKIGNNPPQSDRFLGFDYNYPELPVGADESVGILARYLDAVDTIIPIPYGERWVEPVLMGAHGPSSESNVGWASWQTGRKGPFVVALIGEGPVDTGIVSPALKNVTIDNSPLDYVPFYSDGDIVGVSISTGETTPTVSDLAPQYISGSTNLAGLSGMPNVAYVIVDLPDQYDLEPTNQKTYRDLSIFEVVDLTGSWNPLSPLPKRVKTFWEAKRPDLKIKYKGRKVQLWTGPVNPTKGSIAYSRNPVWQILDLISAPQRVAESDVFSGAIPESQIDHKSFVHWAGYCDDTVTMRDAEGQEFTGPRYQTDYYITTQTRAQAISDLLQACRGSLVEKDGKVGIVLEAPRGGAYKSGVSTVSGTATTLTDSARDGESLPTWPDNGFQNGGLEGMKVEILAGTGAGQVRTIASNDSDTITVTSAWATNPSTDSEYTIYALKLTADNVGNVQFRRNQPTHKITNEIVATFDVNDNYGRQGTVRLQDTYVDGFGDTYIERFGKNSRTMELGAITDYSYAVRIAWAHLQKGILSNRHVVISGANIEAMPLEVGDIVCVDHPVSGLDNQLFVVQKITTKQNNQYDIVATLYDDDLYLDWPTFSPDGVTVRSRFRAPHEVPPHVTSLAVTKTERDNAAPIINVSWVKPPWEYTGGETVVEVSTDSGATWNHISRSELSATSFAAQANTSYDVRAVFVSHTATRADAPLVVSTATGGTASTLVDTARAVNAPFTDDLYTGWTALLRKGTGTEESKIIASNTSDTLTITGTWTNNPAASDPYEIYRPPPTGSVTTSDVFVTGPSIMQWISEEKLTPGDPTNLSGVEGLTQNTVDLTWVDNATDEVEYFVYRAPDVSGSPGTWNNITVAGLPANTQAYTDNDTTTLQTQALWWYRVRCRSIYGFSEYSNEDQVDLSAP